MSRIFLSHSSQDNAAAVALRDWLVAEGWDDLFLDLDPQRGIVAGERWERALYEAANRCQAVVILISRAWLHSGWCRKEMILAMRLGKPVFGLLIEPIRQEDLPPELSGNWQTVRLAEGADHRIFRATLPDGSEAHVTFSVAGLVQFRSGLVKAGLDPRFFAWPPEGEPDRAPWRGMLPLEASDAGIFFGREAALIEAMDHLRNMADGAPPRMLAILGASGAGKSSFLRAGLLPRLARDDRHFLALPVIRPERAVLSGEAEGLVSALVRAHAAARLPLSRAEAAAAIAAGATGLRSCLSRLVDAARIPGTDAPLPTLVLPLDQAEELFNAEGRREAEQFLDLLANLLTEDSPRLICLTTIRSDAYERLQSVAALDGLRQQTFSLPPLPRGQWVSVIEGPAARAIAAGQLRRLDPALTAALLTEAEAESGGDALPLLAFALGRLYHEHAGKGALRLADYRGMNGIAGAVDVAIERALARADGDPSLPRSHEARLALLRRGLIPWLAGVDLDSDAARRRSARISDIPAEARPLIAHLVAERLLTLKQSWITDASGVTVPSGAPMVEPVHEALLRQWGSLRDWLEEDRALLTTLEALRRAARDWQTHGRDPVWASHRAGRLEDAEHLAERPDLWAMLGEADRAYLVECRGIETRNRDRELTEARKLAEAERDRASAERGKRRWAVAGGGVAAALALVALIAGALALQKAAEADRQAEKNLRNESIALASLAREAMVAGRLHDALKLALASWPRIGDPDRPELRRTLDILREILPNLRENPVTIRTSPFLTVASFSPDGQLVMTASDDGIVQLWEAATGQRVGQPLQHDARVWFASFSPDGRILATSTFTWRNEVRFWDVASGRPLGRSIYLAYPTEFTGFSVDGRLLMTISRDRTARIFEVATGRLVGAPMRHEDEINSVSLSPDGSLVLTASDDGSARLWDATTGTPVGVAMRHEGAVNSAWFSADGRLVLTASDDGSARFWDAFTGRPVGARMRHDKNVFVARFSPDGQRVLTAAFGGTAQLWNAATRTPIGAAMSHDDAIVSAGFSPDGRMVLTIDYDGRARLWEASTGQPLGVPMDHSADSSEHKHAEFSPDGQMVLTADGWAGTVRLWNVAPGLPVGAPMLYDGGTMDDDSIPPASFSPDGRRVLTVSLDHSAQVWDAQTGLPVGQPMRHSQIISSASFSPDGRRVATASWDGTAQLWDAETGAPVGAPMRHQSQVTSAGFSPDGLLLVTSSADQSARLWEVPSGNPVGKPMRHAAPVLFAGFSPNGRLVLTTSADDTAQLWEVTTAQPIGNPVHHDVHGAGGFAASFSPDGGRVLAVSAEDTLQLWDVASGTPVGEPMRSESSDPGVRENFIASAKFSPDGRRIVMVTGGDKVLLWDPVTGKPDGPPIDRRFLYAAGISPDGQLVVTTAAEESDGTQLWDMATRLPVGAPIPGNSWRWSATFSPDGRLLLSQSDNGFARSWALPDPQLHGWARVCALLGNDTGLSAVEERYGLDTLAPICGDSSPLPVDWDRLE